MISKLKNITIAIIVVVSVICVESIIPVFAESDNKTVYVNYYLTDDQENYINWDGDRIDLEQRILVKEEVYTNKYSQGSKIQGEYEFTNSEGIKLYLAVGMKTVDYKGKSSCEVIFGAYMNNTVKYMDWKSSQDHTYQEVDSKPVRFPNNLAYDAKEPGQKQGYTFIGWYDEQGHRFEKDSIITKDMSVYAKYVEDNYKKEYKINHYTEQLNGDYTLYESETNQATDNQKILATHVMKTGLTGFGFNSEKSDQSIVVGQDQVLNLYYDRDIKTVTFMSNNKVFSIQNIKYGGKPSMPDIPTCEGYRFVKWNTRQDGTGRDFNVNDNTTYDSIYYAVFESLPSYQYTVNYYQESANGYRLVNSQKKFAFEGEIINATDDQKNLYDGYEYNYEKSDQNVMIFQNGQNVSFYYDRVVYPYIIQYYYDGILDINKNEIGVAYLHDIITEFQDKSKKGFELLDVPALIIGKENNILRIDYVRKEYQVRFFDRYDQIIKSEMVKYGDSANAPKIPEVTGMYFVGWDKDMTNITTALDIRSQYEINTYIVEFQDINGDTISKQIVAYGKDASLPYAPVINGYEFIGWKGNYKNIQNNEIVKAQYREIEETVVPPVDNPGDTTSPIQRPTEIPEITVPALIMPQQTPFTNGEANQVETINDQNQVKQEETLQITDQQTPKSIGTVEKQWALLNLIAVVLSIILLIILFLSKKSKEENEDMMTRRKWVKIVALFVALASIIIFILTENIFMAMRFSDQYTIIMLVLSFIQMLMLVIGRRYKDNSKINNNVLKQ